jgi:hypothetical protein
MVVIHIRLNFALILELRSRFALAYLDSSYQLLTTPCIRSCLSIPCLHLPCVVYQLSSAQLLGLLYASMEILLFVPDYI